MAEFTETTPLVKAELTETTPLIKPHLSASRSKTTWIWDEDDDGTEVKGFQDSLLAASSRPQVSEGALRAAEKFLDQLRAAKNAKSMEEATICSEPTPEGLEKKSFLHSITGQVMLCGLVIFTNVYESVLKGKAVNSKTPFNYGSVFLVQGVFSVVAVLGFSVPLNTFRTEIFTWNAPQLIKLYTVPAALFTLGAYLQFICLEHLPPHIFWVLDQMRILFTAVLARVIRGQSQSWTGWSVLVVISWAAVVYTLVDTLEEEKSTLLDRLSSSNPEQEVAKKERNMLLGLFTTFLSVCCMSGASIYCEAVLKSKHMAPFYIQKFFLELNAIVVSLLAMTVVAPQMETWNLKRKSSQGTLWEVGPFFGWNMWVVLVAVTLTFKSWLVGILIKNLNSLSNLLCGVIALSLIYPMAALHGAGSSSSCPNSQIMCIGDLQRIHINEIVTGVMLCAACLTYAAAKRDRERILLFFTAAQRQDGNIGLGSV
jgi:hypothetical protein